MRRFLYLVVLVDVVCRLHAQTPPCGIVVVHSAGQKTDERFVSAPPEQVKVAVLKALPAVAGEVKKNERFHIEAESSATGALRESITQTNFDSGIRDTSGGLPFGKFTIDIREEARDGVNGSLLQIKFEKPRLLGAATNHGNNAQPLAEETACLAKLLSTNDPATNPRGLAVENAGAPRSVAIPEGTEVKVLLRDPLWSKALNKHSAGQIIQFEVAADVVVDGATLIRRGALATGHFTDVLKAKGYGRHAEVEFVFDKVTAVDGQGIPIADEGEKAKGGRTEQTAVTAILLPALGWLATGADVFIPAGTTYDVATSGQHSVQTGR
jgi:hypothetical protein